MREPFLPPRTVLACNITPADTPLGNTYYKIRGVLLTFLSSLLCKCVSCCACLSSHRVCVDMSRLGRHQRPSLWRGGGVSEIREGVFPGDPQSPWRPGLGGRLPRRFSVQFHTRTYVPFRPRLQCILLHLGAGLFLTAQKLLKRCYAIVCTIIVEVY